MSAYWMLDSANALLKWRACEQPERPPDSYAHFDLDCKACRIALEAALSAPSEPGRFDGWWRSRDTIRAEIERFDTAKGGE